MTLLLTELGIALESFPSTRKTFDTIIRSAARFTSGKSGGGATLDGIALLAENLTIPDLNLRNSSTDPMTKTMLIQKLQDSSLLALHP